MVVAPIKLKFQPKPIKINAKKKLKPVNIKTGPWPSLATDNMPILMAVLATIDGKSTIDWLTKKGVDEKNLILYGESLGTGVAVHLAQYKNYAGVILETPFTSMIDTAKKFYPYIPVSLLLKDKFENYKKIKNINSPILVMHGEVDQIVPFFMGKKIYELANKPKYSYFTKYDDHMMEYDENLVLALKSFLKSLN